MRAAPGAGRLPPRRRPRAVARDAPRARRRLPLLRRHLLAPRGRDGPLRARALSRAVPRAVIACGGVGIAQRGFETFTRECFDALSRRDDVDLVLVKGRGARTPRERVAPTVHRDG